MLNEADIREREGACGLGGGRIKGVVGSGWGSHQGGTGIWGGGGRGGAVPLMCSFCCLAAQATAPRSTIEMHTLP